MKKIIYLITLFTLLLQACSSEESSNTNSTNSSSILLKREERSDEVGMRYYKYNGSKLNFISFGEETGQFLRLQFTYSGDFITKTEWFDNNMPTGEKSTYTYTNNKLTEKRSYSPGAILEYIHNYTYNSNGTIEETGTGYNGNNYNSFKTIYLDSNNNIIKIDFPNYVEFFEYDNKNNPYKNITGFDKFIFNPSLGGTFGCGNNNLTKEIRYYGVITLNNIYNNQNFPVTTEIIEANQSPILCNYYYN